MICKRGIRKDSIQKEFDLGDVWDGKIVALGKVEWWVARPARDVGQGRVGSKRPGWLHRAGS